MTKNETSLGTAAMSKNCQTYIIPAVRPHIGVKRGEPCEIEFVLDKSNGNIYIRKAEK